MTDTLDLSSPDPSAGTAPPRARFRSSLPQRSLDGAWRFRWSPTVAAAPAGVEAVDLDDSGWEELPVPSSWPLHGYGAPAYTNVQFPFPLDPPHPPDANPVGDHRLTFAVEAGSPYLDGARLRFDGVDGAGEVWLNGTHLGSTRGSRLTQELDVGGVLVEGANVLAVRVTQWSAASYLEDQDMWWLPGIFRSVTLLSQPTGSIEDLVVEAGWQDGLGRLRVVVTGPAGAPLEATVSVPEIGLEVAAGEGVDLGPVDGWTAETPRLYDLVVTTPTETVTERVGFRTVTWDGVLAVNGRPLLLRGVNRHEHHPDLGRVVPREVLRDELHLMKQHNVNAIRTSHYPPHPDLLELADELGFWLVDEVDQETHGFELAGWRGNPIDDERWRPALLDRVRRTVTRDRNRPCVIGWSLGNESGMGVNIAPMADLVRELDASRFVHYEPDVEGLAVDVMSRMYTHPDDVALWATRSEPALDDPAADARRRAMPFLLCEYVHAMGTGPGAIEDYQRLFEGSERLAGGFVWEWVEHGIRQTHEGPDGPEEFFAYGGDFGEVVHDGNFVCDGLVSPDRAPRPGLVDWKHAVQPLRMTITDDRSQVEVRSTFDHGDASHLELRWQTDGPDGVVGSGTLGRLAVPPGGTVVLDLPADARARMPSASAPGVLTVSAVVADDLPWAPAGHEIAWVQAGEVAGPVARQTVSVAPRVEDDGWVLGPARFASATGLLTSIGELQVDGPRLALWRAPTDNDNGLDRRRGARDADDWAAQGLHRLVARLVAMEADGETLVVRHRVAAAVLDRHVDVETRWSADAQSVTVETTLTPVGDWGPSWARIGLDLTVGDLGARGPDDGVGWEGYGPGQRYPDTGAGARLGWWDATVDALQVPYVRPQENGSRTVTGALRLPGADGADLLVRSSTAAPFGFSARPWSVAALAAAEHTPELRPDHRLHLSLDHRQHGIGTAACGPGVLPAHRLEPSRLAPEDLTFGFTFTLV